jgi:hypothetical protein
MLVLPFISTSRFGRAHSLRAQFFGFPSLAVSAVIIGRLPGYTTLFDVGKRRVFCDFDGSSRIISGFV